MSGITEDLINPESVIADMIRDEWEDHNTLDGGESDERSIKTPDVVEIDSDSSPGQTTRNLPSTIRARPVVFVWTTNSVEPEMGDSHWITEDVSATVRAQVVVASGLNGRSGKETRTDYVRILTDIRRDNRHHPGGSRWDTMEPGTIDRTPTEYTNQWRVNIDLVLNGYNKHL